MDQAFNRPGLAATLAALWLEGGGLSVLRGEALTRTTLYSLRRLVGQDEEGLLAVFSLGGRYGMPTKAVGEKLGLNALEMRQRLESLATAGVLSDVGDDCLAVEPRALRPVLLTSVFFSPRTPRLDYGDFLDLAPGYDCAVLEIVTAASRGARVSTAEMRRLLVELDPAKYPLRKDALRAWRTYASLGPQEALWVFEHYPGELVDVARSGLDSAPEDTLRLLLEEASSAEEPSPLARPQVNLLRTWLHEIADDTLERRRLALRVAREYAEGTGSAGALDIAFHLGCLTLRPSVEGNFVDPTRTAVSNRHGPLSQSQLKRMGASGKTRSGSSRSLA